MVIYFRLYHTNNFCINSVYFHSYEVAGRMWPLVFSRIIIGLIIFELTSAGLFTLNKSYPLAALCVPLIFLTVAYKIVMDKAYQRSTQFLPLQLLSEKLGPMTTIATANQQSREASSSTSNSDESSLVHPLSNMENTNGNGAESSTSKLTPAAAIINNNSASQVATMKNRKRRTVLDEDDYVAEPRKCTDFREPPMTLLDGILNTGMKQYGHPALLGVLPQIWLPVGKKSAAAAADYHKYREIVAIPPSTTTSSSLSISSLSKRKAATNTPGK
jgi:hypothetical protein